MERRDNRPNRTFVLLPMTKTQTTESPIKIILCEELYINAITFICKHTFHFITFDVGQVCHILSKFDAHFWRWKGKYTKFFGL